MTPPLALAGLSLLSAAGWLALHRLIKVEHARHAAEFAAR